MSNTATRHNRPLRSSGKPCRHCGQYPKWLNIGRTNRHMAFQATCQCGSFEYDNCPKFLAVEEWNLSRG